MTEIKTANTNKLWADSISSRCRDKEALQFLLWLYH